MVWNGTVCCIMLHTIHNILYSTLYIFSLLFFSISAFALWKVFLLGLVRWYVTYVICTLNYYIHIIYFVFVVYTQTNVQREHSNFKPKSSRICEIYAPTERQNMCLYTAPNEINSYGLSSVWEAINRSQWTQNTKFWFSFISGCLLSPTKRKGRKMGVEVA